MKRIELPKNDGMDYVITGTHANIDIDIWIKFAGHFKNSELKFLDECKKKDIDDMTAEELDRYTKLSKQNKLANLFKKYKDKNCTKEEHDAVKKFMENHELDKFVSSRMTKEEKATTDKLISKLTKDELKEFIDTNKDNYGNLSVFDAYVLFMAKEELYDIQTMEHVENTMKRQAEDAQHLRMKLERDFGPMVR